MGTIGILTIAFIAERYLADAMPLLLLAGLAGWHVLADHWATVPAGAEPRWAPCSLCSRCSNCGPHSP